MDLPYEVMVMIFKYLPEGDRKAASETCQAWYSAANDHTFLKIKCTVFNKACLINDDNITPMNIFESSSVNHYNYFFNEVEISNKLNYFWDIKGEYIKTLTFRSCDICEKTFTYILEKCTNLETLNIICCKELFMSGRLLEGKTEGLLKYNLVNLKALSLSDNQYLTDALIHRFVVASPALNELDFSGCSLQFHIGLVKKFYGSNVDMFQNPSESVITFSFILKVIAARAESIKHLSLSQTLIDESNLKTLSEMNNLKLETLKLHGCDQLTYMGIHTLTTHQTSLKELDLGSSNRVEDQYILDICHNLVNLEQLNIQCCRSVTNRGAVELKMLSKLRILNIAQCENITSEGLENGICAKENKTLTKLDVHSLNLDEDALIMMSEKLPNLRSLNLSYCFNAVTDESIQVIFKNQIFLEELLIKHCDKVSDAGLTGMKKDCEDDPYPDSNSNTSYNDMLSNHRIHLGSRAEEEIVRDARRKHDVKHMCEKLSTENYTGYSLDQLKSLKKLDISCCNRITDVSLTYSFNFTQLISLELSRCQQITHVGIEQLVKNCPAIEKIYLADCYNLTDDAVTMIVQKLRRLRFLQLKGCNQLTHKTVEAVKAYCEKLQVLDLQGCRHIPTELACNIGLATLHTVLLTKPGFYPEGTKSGVPPLAFFPALMRKLRFRL